MIAALARIKSYLDYGVFQPVQIASIIALRECAEETEKIRATYQKRRDVLVEGLGRAGWEVEKPRGTMFVWAALPARQGALRRSGVEGGGWQEMGSLEFAKVLLEKALVAVSPGVGFGPLGEGYVRFALVENEQRIRQAVRGIARVLRKA
jgi:alanine-synthesizing transaminase